MTQNEIDSKILSDAIARDEVSQAQVNELLDMFSDSEGNINSSGIRDFVSNAHELDRQERLEVMKALEELG